MPKESKASEKVPSFSPLYPGKSRQENTHRL